MNDGAGRVEIFTTISAREDRVFNMSASLVQRSTNQIACDMGGEVVILDLKSGTYYGLDLLGARVWNLIEQPASVPEIRDAIVADYDVDAETCERDILAFLKQMQVVGLVEISNGSLR